MPFLYNNQTQRMENVPDDAVQDGVFSGAYSFRKGTRIPVVLNDGRQGSVDAEDFNPSAGVTYLGTKAAKQLMQQKTAAARVEAFGDTASEFAAGAAGALRGGTFGLSDVALSAAGFADELQTLKEVNPTASMIGEAAGTVASLATGLGAGSLAAKAGEKATSALFTGAATKATDRVIRAGLGSAVEGALFSTGQIVSEAALGDPELNASHVLSTIGLGTLLGGGLGAFGKGAGETINKTWDALKQSTLPNASANAIGKAYSKVLSIVKGADEETAKDLTQIFSTSEGRNRLLSLAENPRILEDSMLKAVDDVKNVANEIQSASMELRQVYRETLDQQATKPAKSEALKIADKFAQKAEFVGNNPLYVTSDAPKLRQISDDLYANIRASKTQGELHQAVETARIDLDGILKYGSDSGKGANKKSSVLLKKFRGEVKDYLKNETHFGDFANRYDAINSAYNQADFYSKKFAKAFTEETPTMSGGVERLPSPTKVAAYIRNPEALKNVPKLEVLENTLNSVKKLAETSGDNAELYAKYSGIADNLKRTINSIRENRASVIMLNRLESQTGKSLGGMLLTGAGAQALGAGPGSLAVGGLLGYAVTNPMTTLRHLVRLEKLGQEGAQASVSAVERMLGSAVSTVKPVGRFAAKATPQVSVSVLNNLLGNNKTDDIDALKKSLERSTIQYADDLVTAQNPLLYTSSPEHHAAMVNTTKAAFDFLKTKIPTDRSASLIPNKAVNSSSIKHDLDVYADAAFRPARLFEEMVKPNPDARVIEAVATVYPQLYSRVTEMVVDGITQNPDKLSYKQKLKLGIFLRTATTPTLGHLGQIQAMYQTPEMKDTATGGLQIDYRATAAAQGDFTQG